jgi:type IV pilus assembly protein PilA
MTNILHKKRRLLGNKGFSLVELIIVIAIMAVLMAVLAPQLIKYVEKSRIQADDSAAAEILNAVRIALTDEEIYTAVTATDTVVWAGSGGSITANGGINGTDILSQISSIVGTPGEPKSKTRKADNYTITFDLSSGSPVASGKWDSESA